MAVCLDSWAVLRWLEGVEPVAGDVAAVLAERPAMSWVNLGEVAYVVERAAGAPRAAEVVADLRRRLDLDPVTPERVLAAARIKAHHRLALADAFAVATSEALQAELWTGDPEILDAGAGWVVRDLRAA